MVFGASKFSSLLRVLFLLTENWWAVLEHPKFMRLVQLFKDVVLHLLKLTKIGIPFSERRIFNTFLNTSFKILEILHRVCLDFNKYEYVMLNTVQYLQIIVAHYKV